MWRKKPKSIVHNFPNIVCFPTHCVAWPATKQPLWRWWKDLLQRWSHNCICCTRQMTRWNGKKKIQNDNLLAPQLGMFVIRELTESPVVDVYTDVSKQRHKWRPRTVTFPSLLLPAALCATLHCWLSQHTPACVWQPACPLTISFPLWKESTRNRTDQRTHYASARAPCGCSRTLGSQKKAAPSTRTWPPSNKTEAVWTEP